MTSGLANSRRWEDRLVEVVTEWDCVAVRAHQAFVAAFGEHRIPMTNKFLKFGNGTTQKWVDVELTDASRSLPINDFADRIIRPAASELAASTPRGQSFVSLELPLGCQAAQHEDEFVSIRAIAAWRHNPIYNDAGYIIGYTDPVPVLRLDVLTTINIPETI